MSNQKFSQSELLAKAVKFEIGEEIYVERRSEDRWAVSRNGFCLNQDGEFEYEPMTSHREEEFLNRTRFSFEDAMDRAFLALKRYTE